MQHAKLCDPCCNRRVAHAEQFLLYIATIPEEHSVVRASTTLHAKRVRLRWVFYILLPVTGRVTRQHFHGACLVEEDDRVKLAIQPCLGVVRVTLCLRSLQKHSHHGSAYMLAVPGPPSRIMVRSAGSKCQRNALEAGDHMRSDETRCQA